MLKKNKHSPDFINAFLIKYMSNALEEFLC
jgi:hypothetical protein